MDKLSSFINNTTFRCTISSVVLILIILLAASVLRDYSYLKTLEKHLDDSPKESYQELVNYQKQHIFKDKKEEKYFNLLLDKATLLQKPNDIPSKLSNTYNRIYELDEHKQLQSECLELLGNLCINKENPEKSAQYFKKSLYLKEQVIKKFEEKKFINESITLITIILAISFSAAFIIISRKKQSEIVQRTKKELFGQKKYELSKVYLSDNKKKIDELQKKLDTTSNLLKEKEKEYLQIKKNNLEIRNQEQEIRKSRISSSLLLLRHSECARRFIKASTDHRITISHSDWKDLCKIIMKEFPNLVCKLEQNQKITLTEKKVCYLSLLEIGTLEMANVTKLKSSSISSAKKSLYEKITGQHGSAKDLQQTIINIIV